MPRSSVVHYKGKDAEPRVVGRELNVSRSRVALQSLQIGSDLGSVLVTQVALFFKTFVNDVF
jgi:hypothetical protein